MATIQELIEAKKKKKNKKNEMTVEESAVFEALKAEDWLPLGPYAKGERESLFTTLGPALSGLVPPVQNDPRIPMNLRVALRGLVLKGFLEEHPAPAEQGEGLMILKKGKGTVKTEDVEPEKITEQFEEILSTRISEMIRQLDSLDLNALKVSMGLISEVDNLIERAILLKSSLQKGMTETPAIEPGAYTDYISKYSGVA